MKYAHLFYVICTIYTQCGYSMAHSTRQKNRITSQDTALREAVNMKDEKEVARLIAVGANPNAGLGLASNDGWVALHDAATLCNVRIVERLLHAHASVNAQTHNGTTPLHLAVFYGQEEVAKLLIANRANPLCTNGDNETPIDIARKFKESRMLELLEEKK